MPSLTTPRLGRSIERVMMDHYGPFYVGVYRSERNCYLVRARATQYDETRAQCIRWAMEAHRSMMRCLRELRREERLNEETA